MHEHDEVVLAVAGHVGHGAFARLGQRVLRAAKRVLLEHLPAVARHQLARRREVHHVEIVFRRLHKNKLLAPAAGEVAGNHVIEIAVLDGRVVIIQPRELPDIAAERQPRHGILSGERHRRRAAERHGADGTKRRHRQFNVLHHLPHAVRVALAQRQLLVFRVEEKQRRHRVRAVHHRRRADDTRVAVRAVNLILHGELPTGRIRRAGNLRLRLQHDGAQEIFLRQQQLRLAVAIHIGGSEPRLLHRAARWIHVHLVKRAVLLLQQHLDLFVGNQHHQIREAVLVHVLNGERRGIGLETVAQLLRRGLAVGGARDERADAVLVHEDGERRLCAGFQRAHGQRQRLAIERQRRGKRQSSVLVKLRHRHGVFIMAQ